jgi:hypothetical protein
MNDLVASPYGQRTAVATQQQSVGARQAQSRELAEMQTKFLMAQQFPRDVMVNTDKILNAFTRPTLAEKSQYQYAKGGTDVTGPSIRAAEAMAQQWGNLETGWRILGRSIGEDGIPFSEVEAWCTDLEARGGKRIQFPVPHWRDKKNNQGYKLTDERDIYELCSNQAQRRLRACILATIPGDVTEAAMAQAAKTLATTADTSPEAMAKVVEAYDRFGVSKEQIEKRIQRRLDSIRPAQVVELRRIYASLRDDMSEPKDWFEMDLPVDGAPAAATGAAGVKEQLKARGKAKKVPAAAPAQPAEKDQAAQLSAEDYIARIDDAAGPDDATALLEQARKALPVEAFQGVQHAYEQAWNDLPPA